MVTPRNLIMKSFQTPGDIVMLTATAVNSDAAVKRLKGTSRPVISERDRAAMLAALSCVSHVIVFGDDTPHALLHRLRPDVLIKGGNYTEQEVVGREIVDAYRGQVRVVGLVDGVSTTRLLHQISSKSRSSMPKEPENA
jgi:D-beta-D-heptose 7-phosphate kinase/D-beta-D-heptose 1-phosphate adenosyltransferase